MSGRKIDDHSFWAGGKSKDSVLPMGAKQKHLSDAESAAHVGTEYPDTEEVIHKNQNLSASKAKGHKMRPGYRY